MILFCMQLQMRKHLMNEEKTLEIISKIFSNQYLHNSGWFRSYTEQAVVDGEGRPLPWMNYPVIELLRERVAKGVDIFEYGCGFGTLWWAERAHKVVAVEHDKAWFERMSPQFPDNVRAIFCELVRGGDYCKTVSRLKFQKFNIIIIDGRDRVNCALHCADSLKDDGVVIFDDTDREEYTSGREHLKGLGFKELRIMGLKPMVLSVGAATSIFYREGNCLGL